MAEAALKDPPSGTRPRMTLARFLSWDDGTDTRYELVRGEVRAMAPTVVAHADIVSNLTRAIGNRLRPPCRASGGAGVIPLSSETFYVPDLVVDCAERRPGERYLGAPRVIVEVLSESTAAHDLDVKLPDYCLMPSVEAIALVDSRAMRVQLWRRRADGGWLVDDLRAPEQEIVMESLGLRIPLALVYDGVALGGGAATGVEAEAG
jgi:Uma2 family endonuclease